MRSDFPDVLHRAWAYARGIAGLQADDILLASYPKSGNTWVRFFLCNLISIAEKSDKTIDFQVLNASMPELGISNLLLPWPHSAIPRFVKTHKPCWHILRKKKSVLIVRDPRDVMVSFYNYRLGRRQQGKTKSFPEFIRDPRFGLRGWFAHYCSWKPYCKALVRFEDLKQDDLSTFTKMFRDLEISVDGDLVREATLRSRFDRVRAIEERFGRGNPDRHNPDARFTRSGESGGWRKLFSDADQEYLDKLKSEFGVPSY